MIYSRRALTKPSSDETRTTRHTSNCACNLPKNKLFEHCPHRRLNFRELRQGRPHPVDGLKELHELAGGIRSMQLSQSLGSLRVVVHRLYGEDFPAPLDLLSDENGHVGCSKKTTLQQAI